MRQLPILFTFTDKVAGNGFVAKVIAHGRALASEEEGGWWLYGVQPGGIAAGGATLAEAQVEFRKDFTAVLFDIADEAKDPASFEAGVRDFFGQTNQPTADDWQTAVSWVRHALQSAAGEAEANPAGLPVRSAEAAPRGVEVKVLVMPTPNDNVLDAELALAA